MPHPAGLPDLFIDRSLGRIQLPQLLRDAGLRLVTLAERYGIPNDETITDKRWLSDVGDRGEAAFMKDGRVRYNPAEKAAIVRHRVRCFCLLAPRPVGRRNVTAVPSESRSHRRRLRRARPVHVRRAREPHRTARPVAPSRSRTPPLTLLLTNAGCRAGLRFTEQTGPAATSLISEHCGARGNPSRASVSLLRTRRLGVRLPPSALS